MGPTSSELAKTKQQVRVWSGRTVGKSWWFPWVVCSFCGSLMPCTSLLGHHLVPTVPLSTSAFTDQMQVCLRVAFKHPQNRVHPEGVTLEAFLSEHGCNTRNRNWPSDAFWCLEGCAVVPSRGKHRLPFGWKQNIPRPATACQQQQQAATTSVA